jgi:SAM-dependent methyltransferase
MLPKLSGVGIEIGAHMSPIPDVQPFYVDRFIEFGGTRCLIDAQAEAERLPFVSGSLDYVASSHLIEHIANPIRALLEWHRVLKPGGFIWMVVPDRRETFDRKRERTPLSHLIADYEKGTTQSDAQHIDDFIDNVDWAELHPDDPYGARKEYFRKLYSDTVAAGGEINIHFHVFELGDILALIAYMRHAMMVEWEVAATEERYPAHCPNGFLVVLRKLTAAKTVS